jgi:hypothetical protein
VWSACCGTNVFINLDCGALAVGQMCLQIGLWCASCGTDMFVNWTVVFLLWDRCVCKLDRGDLAMGQTSL